MRYFLTVFAFLFIFPLMALAPLPASAECDCGGCLRCGPPCEGPEGMREDCECCVAWCKCCAANGLFSPGDIKSRMVGSLPREKRLHLVKSDYQRLAFVYKPVTYSDVPDIQKRHPYSTEPVFYAQRWKLWLNGSYMAQTPYLAPVQYCSVM